MTARLLAVALAFAITGAPVALTICETACATRSASMQGGGEHHSCHEGVSSSQPRFSAVPHGCGHADGSDQLGADVAAKIFAPPIVLAGCVTFVVPTLDVSALTGLHALGHSPPGPLAVSTQLRL